MDYFLTRVIDDGIAAARADYVRDTPEVKARLQGAVAGFEACRGLTPEALVELGLRAHQEAQQAYWDVYAGSITDEAYEAKQCYALEVEWVLNVLSAGIGRPLLGHLPTARGAIKAQEILMGTSWIPLH